MFRRVTHSLARLHGDQSGNLSILLLLTVWCLVAMIAMIWNTGEVATRRQNLQTVADSTAHAAVTWVARAENVEAAQNMIICQDGSMETIWRAVTPTDQRVRAELEKEQADVLKMQSGGDDQFNQLHNRMLTALQSVDNEYAQTTTALANVNGLSGQASADPVAAKQFATTVRQATDMLSWTQNTYVNGTASGVAGRPGPPGPNGEGLRQLVTKWSPPASDDPFLQAILASLTQQLAVLAQFEARTAPAMAQDAPTRAANHETEVFQNEQQIADQMTQTIQTQLSQMADFYKTKLTLATTGLGAQGQGPAQIQPPFLLASDPLFAPQSHTDLIQQRTVMIDPINAQADDAKIIHPDVDAAVPENLLAQYPNLPPTFRINCNIPDGWGHSYGTPIKRYFNGRVANDEQQLAVYFQQIDLLRRQLGILLAQLRGMGNSQRITPLPFQLQDSVADPKGNFPMVPVLPQLSAPADASDQLRAAVAVYNKHGSAYTGAVRSLASQLSSWARYYDRFTVAFAASVWSSEVDIARALVLRELGIKKQFVVLATYRLRPIPDWAQPGMRVSAEANIRDRIISDNIGPVSRAILRALTAADPNGLGAGFLDPVARNGALSADYSQLASQLANSIVTTTAAQVAPVIAAEWVSRPWPYEITPPETRVPPSQGMTTPDRQKYFTLLTAAMPTDDNSPKLFMGKLMGNPATPSLLAYAQAESFNWMEFNPSYGGSERFDEVTQDNNADFVGSPNPWRLCSIGGWSWNSRLAGADTLDQALDANPELQTFFQNGGVTTNDSQALHTLQLH